MASRYRVVLVTVPGKKEGQKIAQGLVSQKLAACVNILPGVESTYRWKNKVETSSELLLVIKTQRALMDNVISYVKQNHPDEVCEVISLPIMEGNKSYLEWIGASTNLAVPMHELDEEGLDKEVG